MKKSNYSYVVIEDVLTVCKAIKKRMDNYEQWECLGLIPSYEQALEVIQKEKPDLLFLDHTIRGGNSFSLLDEIRKIDSYSPYVLYFTAYLVQNPEIFEDAINEYKVNKFLNKPVFEKLTAHLTDYVHEAQQWTDQQSHEFVWFETLDKVKHKVQAENIMFISQPGNPRNKIIHLSTGEQLEIRSNWKSCESIIKASGIDYFVPNARHYLVSKKYITEIKKPFIWIDSKWKMEVSKENWKGF